MDIRIKGSFYTGNFKSTLQQITPQLQSNPILQTFKLRSLAQLGKLQTIDPSTSDSFIYFKLLSDYLQKKSSAQNTKEKIPSTNKNLEQLLHSIISINQGNSMQVIQNLQPSNLESQALIACALLKINRAQTAKQVIQKSQAKQGDQEVLLQLAMIWALIAKGEYQEASGNIVEVISKYGESVNLLNAQTLCALEDGNLEEARHVLERAVQSARESSGRELGNSIRNLISVYKNQGEDSSGLEAELRSVCPDHEYFQQVEEASELFEKLIS